MAAKVGARIAAIDPPFYQPVHDIAVTAYALCSGVTNML